MISKAALLFFTFIFAIVGEISNAAAKQYTLLDVARLAEKNAVSKALVILNAIERQKENSPSKDLIELTRGRLYFQKGELNKAYASYDLVPKSSDFWLTAMEEKSHVMGRKGEYAKTLALLQTVMAPTFADLVGPEPYFVAALTDLKICDYAAIFKVTGQFKEKFRNRIAALSEIDKIGDSQPIRELMLRLQDKKLNLSTVGSLAAGLPRDLSHDIIMQNLSHAKPSALREHKLRNRIQQLARAELSEISGIANKLQVIEAEVIQRVQLADKKQAPREQQGQIANNMNVLSFPVTDEVWIDELDHYSAQVEKCPSKSRKASL